MIAEEENITKNAITNYYSNFELIHPVDIVSTKQFDTSINFKQSKEYPRHRWYTYKEGFSSVFVSNFLDKNYKRGSNVVFDPFGGIGTTVLESSIKGLKAYSNDINPLSNFIAKVKTNFYSKHEKKKITRYLNKFMATKLLKKADPPSNQTVIKYFSEETLDIILRIQYWINSINDCKTKDLFRLALLTILEQISTHKKDGNGVKRKKNFDSSIEIHKVKDLIEGKLHSFLLDINDTPMVTPPILYQQSSLNPYSLNEPADIVITSPPYANCFDYSKIYLIELWFGGFFKNKTDQQEFRESSITSHVHYKWESRHQKYGHDLVNTKIFQYLLTQKLWDKKIPFMLSGYFSDMGKVLFELIPNLKKNAIVGFVVGNSVYAGLPIATDILLAEIGIKLGFELVGIESYRTLTPSSQQLKIIRKRDKKYLRESLITFKWK